MVVLGFYLMILTKILRKDIDIKYSRMSDQKLIDEIAGFIYNSYKSFG